MLLFAVVTYTPLMVLLINLAVAWRARMWSHMQCDIQEDGARMCGTCWVAAREGLSAVELRILVRAYPPAAAAAELWGKP